MTDRGVVSRQRQFMCDSIAGTGREAPLLSAGQAAPKPERNARKKPGQGPDAHGWPVPLHETAAAWPIGKKYAWRDSRHDIAAPAPSW